MICAYICYFAQDWARKRKKKEMGEKSVKGKIWEITGKTAFFLFLKNQESKLAFSYCLLFLKKALHNLTSFSYNKESDPTICMYRKFQDKLFFLRILKKLTSCRVKGFSGFRLQSNRPYMAEKRRISSILRGSSSDMAKTI